MAISQPTAPAPAPTVPIKRQASPGLTDGRALLPTSQSDNHLAKRKRFFHDLTTKPQNLVQDPKPSIASAQDLTNAELQECYVIARTALKAQFEHREMTPEGMEEFLELVFLGWTTRLEVPAVGELDRFPLSSNKWTFPSPVGQVYSGRLSPDDGL